jgi:hypothetical protein
LISVCDPLGHSPTAQALDRILASGSYEAELTLVSDGMDTRVALATLYVSDDDVCHGEAATITGRPFILTTDSGMACFGAPRIAGCLPTAQQSEVMSTYSTHYQDTWSWAEIDYGPEGNLVIFSSGLGAGRYSAVWGIGRENKEVRLAVRFDALEAFGINHLVQE